MTIKSYLELKKDDIVSHIYFSYINMQIDGKRHTKNEILFINQPGHSIHNSFAKSSCLSFLAFESDLLFLKSDDLSQKKDHLRVVAQFLPELVQVAK